MQSKIADAAARSCANCAERADIQRGERVGQLHLRGVIEVAAGEAAVLQVELLQRLEVRQLNRAAQVVVRDVEKSHRHRNSSGRNADRSAEAIIVHAVERGRNH